MGYLRLLIQPKRTLIDDLAHLQMPKERKKRQSFFVQAIRAQALFSLLLLALAILGSLVGNSVSKGVMWLSGNTFPSLSVGVRAPSQL